MSAGPADRHPLAMNESPFPPLASVVRAGADALSGVHRAPDRTAAVLSARIAERLDVPAASVVVGPGSAALLQMLVMMRCRDGGEVVHSTPGFDLYPFLAHFGWAAATPVPLRDWRHDVPALLAAASERTAVAALCQPNNPTGTVLDAAELGSFVAGMPPECTVVLDEAYREFAAPGTPDGLDHFRADERVCVVRTFSKAHSLFGLRVGYAVAHEPLASTLRAMLMPFMTNSVAQRAALAALDAEDEIRSRCDAVRMDRDRLAGELRGQGWAVPASHGNFVWLPMPGGTAAFVAACAAQGVSVREYPGEGVRITVGTPESRELVVRLAADLVPAAATAG